MPVPEDTAEPTAPSGAPAETPAPRLVSAPADGVPMVTDTAAGLAACAEALAAGTGPVAVDAERASGIRYGQRAFLVQLKREGAGIWLVDPEAFDDLAPLDDALRGVEWILHAASQDLPCLADCGMRPDRLFDTELAARLAGLPRVGLAAVLESQLGLTLAKEHSMADWSRRPLPSEWLTYAALDVELLVPLRDALAALLEEQGKHEWAAQEFEHVRSAPPAPPRVDPWRRTSGASSALKRPVQLAVLRRLWEAREDLARHRDVAPGRLLPDSALVAAASSLPRTVPALRATPGFHGRLATKEGPRWVRAVQEGVADAAAGQAPPRQVRGADGPPPPRAWRERDPLADHRLKTAKPRIARQAEALGMPTENLLTPDTLRRICWAPPEPLTPESVEAALAARGARPWQIEHTAAIITVALLDPEPAED